MTMIITIIRNAHPRQIEAAIRWTADNLHVPWDLINEYVAVGYVCKHFEVGELTGWDGFIEDVGL